MRRVLRLCICSLLLSFTTVAFAVNPDRDVHQLAHRSWGEKEGYPGRAEALAQTADGFLWIGTDDGLFRFDGVRFDQYKPIAGDPLPSGPVRSLRALADGSLWIAYRVENKICVLRNGNLKTYGEADGVTSRPTNIVRDNDGTLWANTEAGLIRFTGKRWEHIGKDWNFPEDVPQVTSQVLFVDSRGGIWTGVNHTVLYLRQGSKYFEPTGVFARWSNSIAEAPDGTIWLADIMNDVRAIGTSASATPAGIDNGKSATSQEALLKKRDADRLVMKMKGAAHLLFDRNGNLWMATDTSGVIRIPHPGALKDRAASDADSFLQTFTSKDGLSADSCTPILEDAEGDIWLGTRDGLDQFRNTPFVPVVLPTSLYRVGIAPADDGDLWVVGSWAYAGKVHGDSGALTLLPTDAFKPYRDHAGLTLFLGSSLDQWKDGRFQKVAPPPENSGSSGSGSWQVASDTSGTLWAFSNGHGFFLLDQHRWKACATPPEVAKQRVANMFSDSTGRIWVSTYEGGIITMDHGSIVNNSIMPNSRLSYVKAFAERSPHEIWAGGAGGLVLIDNGQLRSIEPASSGFLKDVTGIVDAGAEGLWLNGSGGVLHIRKEEVDRVVREPSYRFQSERFDSYDGLPGPAEGIYPYPKAVQGADGRIWFTATRGVAWIDPNNIPKNAFPPPVSITSVSADGSEYLQMADLHLPSRIANLQINYSALSLSVPERVHFRYKLDGVDRDWQDVSSRRQAFYTSLWPGTYDFHVIACNDSGVWNETGDHLHFLVAAAWFQTRLFRGSCIVAFALALWMLYRLRVRSIKMRSKELSSVNVKLEAQIVENALLCNDLQLQVGLLQHLPVSTWTLKPDGTPDFVNQVWLEFSGQTVDLIRSHPEAWLAAVHPEDREMAAKCFWKGVHSGQDFAFETRSRRARDGTYRWHLQQAVVLRDPEGKVIKFVGTTTDIDEQKRTEEALRHVQADLAHVARVTTMGELTASIAHEINQPLSGIMTNASTGVRMLTANPPNLDGLRECMVRTIRDGNRASDVIKRLRGLFSKSEPTIEVVDLNEATREVIALSRSELQRNLVISSLELADGLPPIAGDRIQLQQVVLNLLLNASEAMRSVDDRPRKLIVRTESEDGYRVRLTVKDVGEGLSAQSVTKLFEPFYTTKTGGMGIGLSVSRSIIENHHGRIWATSNDGPGATFCFSLPQASRTSRPS
jgi:PAS domain S-box-containing protein